MFDGRFHFVCLHLCMKTIAQSLDRSHLRHGLAIWRNIRLIQRNSNAKKQDEDAALTWGRHNPTSATACMQPPPMPTSSKLLHQQVDGIAFDDWSSYWKWRKWDFSAATMDAADAEPLSEAKRHAQALTTHVLSAPVTIAHMLFQQSDQCDSLFHNEQATQTFTLRCCCLGARSESMLPVEYWKEVLLLWHYYYFRHQIHSLIPGKSLSSICTPSVQIVLDFLGPDLVVRPPATLTYGDTATLVLRWMFKGKFHDWHQGKHGSLKEDHKDEYDAFIFLNPGIGHPHLKADWKPTLDLLLPPDTHSTKRPSRFLWTAHSKLDADRDMDRLRDYTGTTSSTRGPCDDDSYLENPFSSRITYQDPFDATHCVQPNHYTHCFHVL